MDGALERKLAREFDFIEELSSEDRQGLIAHTTLLEFEAGQHVHNGQGDCLGVLAVCSGTLRAYMLSESGKQLTLFRVGSGQSCVLAATCILDIITFDLFLDAETKGSALVVDPDWFGSLADRNIYVQAFTYRQTAERFSDVMWVMQQVMFMSFDERLAVFLIDESARVGSQSLAITHDEIAKHMGSAREVVSRMLKYFRDEGLVSLSRGRVDLVNRPALLALASHT